MTSGSQTNDEDRHREEKRREVNPTRLLGPEGDVTVKTADAKSGRRGDGGKQGRDPGQPVGDGESVH
jgi:hypothetical protein